MFIDNLDHKSTIHQVSTNTPQKELDRIDLQEDQGELCIEIKRERRSHLANNYGPEGEMGGTGSKVRPVVSCKGTTCQYGLIDTFALSEEIHERFFHGYSLSLIHIS